jgi:hypothetical protein
MRKSWWLGVVLLAGGTAVPALGQVKLEWKLKQGDKFYLEERSVQKQKLKFMGSTVGHQLDLTRVSRFTVLKQGDDGYVLEQTIESVKVNRTTEAAKREAALRKGLEGATFKIQLNPQMRVTKFEGYEALIKKLAKSEDLGVSARVLLPEAELSRRVEALFSFLPGKAVTKGGKWTHEYSLPLGPLGVQKVQDTYTYQGAAKVEGQEVLKLEVANKSSTFTPSGRGGDFFRVVKGDIRIDPKKSKGTVYFSADRGRLVKAVRTTHQGGSLTMDAKGNTLVMDIEQEETATTRMLDKNPLK